MDYIVIWEQIQQFITQYALQVVGAILTLIIGFWVVGRLSQGIIRIMEKREIDISLRSFLGSIVGIGLKALLLLSVAGMFGIEVTSFIAIFSAMAFAVGLALQGNLANFASGVLILVFKFYKVGDFIEAAGKAGVVKEIQIFHTVLQALDNSLFIIPNGQITSNPIRNYTIQGKRRHDITLGISYEADIDEAKTTIEQVLQTTPGAMLDEGYDIFVDALADSSVNLKVRFLALNDDFWPAYRHFMEHIKKEFDKQGIGIPFPQMDLHVRRVPAAVDGA